MCFDRTYTERKALITENEQVASGVFALKLYEPDIASATKPGQFVHVRVSHDSPRILRRPISVHWKTSDTFVLLYHVVGAGTDELSTLVPGDSVDVLGPIGRGWSPPQDVKRALLVIGGLGSAPLAMLAHDLRARGVEVDVAVGAPTAVRLVGLEPYRESACSLSISTDDGSRGDAGYCTQAAGRLLDSNTYEYVATCGPEPMQRIVAQMAAEHAVMCEVSLERRMACGIGACLSCVVETRTGPKRACVDGPVFDASEVVWDA